MIEHDLVTDSIEFWNNHPNLLNEARARVKAGTICPYCGGKPEVLLRVDGKGPRYLCSCRIVAREARQSVLYQDFSAISGSDKLLSFDGIKNPRDTDPKKWATMVAAMDSLKSLSKSPYNHQWVKVAGVPGCGKSTLLLSTYNLIPDAAIYVMAGRLSRQFHDGIQREGSHPDEWVELNDLLRLLIEVPVLLLDDLGMEHDAPFVNNMITDIITQRYQHGRKRPTVVGTNLRKPEMQARYKRIESRLEDGELVAYRPISMDDYRKLKGSK